MKERILIATPALYPNLNYIEKLSKSCEIFNIPLIPYGIGLTYGGWVNAKVTLLLSFLESKLNSYDLLIFLDGGDTWFLSGLDEIVEKYYKFNSNHIISGERECYPIREHAPKYEARIPKGYTNNWQYINCGLQMGKIKSIYNTWKFCHDKYFGKVEDNDAALISTAFFNAEVDFTIDYNCDLFCGMGGRGLQETIEIKNNRIYNKLTNTYPCAIHFNSMPKEPLITDVWNMWINLEHKRE